MAAVQFNCPHCAGLFQVDDSMSGQQVACPLCGGALKLPAMGGGASGGPAGAPATPQPSGPGNSPLYPPGMQSPAPRQPATNRPLYPPSHSPQRPAPAAGGSQTPRSGSQPASAADAMLPPGAASHSPRPRQPDASSSAPKTPSTPQPVNRPIPASGKKSESASVPMSAPRTGGGGGAIDDLLPPGAPSESASARPSPTLGGSPAAKPRGKDGPVMIPTADGQVVAVRDRVKTVGYGDDAVELRQLTPEEKTRRRFKKNLILWGFSLIVIVITLVVLLSIGPMAQ